MWLPWRGETYWKLGIKRVKLVSKHYPFVIHSDEGLTLKMSATYVIFLQCLFFTHQLVWHQMFDTSHRVTTVSSMGHHHNCHWYCNHTEVHCTCTMKKWHYLHQSNILFNAFRLDIINYKLTTIKNTGCLGDSFLMVSLQKAFLQEFYSYEIVEKRRRE